MRNPSREQVRALQRKLLALNINLTSWELAEEQLNELVARTIDDSFAHAIKKWKDRTRFWTIQSRELFSFLKNTPPEKAAAMATEYGETCHPTRILVALSDFWTRLESWPSPESKIAALDASSDHYCLFLPHSPAEVTSDPKSLYDVIQHARKSSPGPDGWTIAEVKALPLAAWRALLDVLGKGWSAFEGTLMLTYKRVPIEKGCALAPLPSSIRPIDVCSVILRAVSSMHVSSIYTWKKKMIFRGQYATHGGTIPAMARLTEVVEQIRRKRGSWFCLTIDFTKLYNMIDTDIVACALKHMGLSERSLELLMGPIALSKGHWRLPHGAASTPYAHARGIPQGLSTSVFAAEAFVSILCWKMQACTSTDIIGYIDDITFCSREKGDFLRALDILDRFVLDFALQMNCLKSCL